MAFGTAFDPSCNANGAIGTAHGDDDAVAVGKPCTSSDSHVAVSSSDHAGTQSRANGSRAPSSKGRRREALVEELCKFDGVPRGERALQCPKNL